MKELFSNRAFVTVMLSDVLQNLGIWIRNMALLFFVVDQTGGSPVAVSLLTIVEYFPIFLFSLIGGVLADRWNPKRTMILGDILSFFSILIILFVIESGFWQAVFVAVAVSAIVSQFSQPSSMKIIKEHVPEAQMQTAMAFAQTLMSLFIIVGPIIGTTIYQTFGLDLSLISLLVVFAASAIVLSFLPKRKIAASTEAASVFTDFKEGFAYVKQHPHLKVLLVMFSILAFGIGLVQPLDVFIIMDRLSLAKENIQWFTALAGAGMLIGGVAAAFVTSKVKGNLIIFSGLVFLGVSTIVEVWSVWPVLTGTMRLVTGIFMAFVQTILATLMITTVNERFIGRINGMMTPIFTGLLLAGTSLSGIFFEATSLITVFVTAGFFFIAAAFVSLRLKISTKEEVLEGN